MTLDTLTQHLTLDHATHALTLIQNGWAAFSLLASVAGLGGIASIVLALVFGAWLPGFVRHGLIALGAVILIGAGCYGLGQAQGAHEAFALDTQRALDAETARADAAVRQAKADKARAAQDLAASQSDNARLKVITREALKRADAARVCLPRDVSRSLRAL